MELRQVTCSDFVSAFEYFQRLVKRHGVIAHVFDFIEIDYCKYFTFKKLVNHFKFCPYLPIDATWNKNLMRYLSHFFTVLTVVLIAACGGSGGANVCCHPPPNPLTVEDPIYHNQVTSIQLGFGATKKYSIVGGTKPYTVSSSNSTALRVWLENEQTLGVGAAAQGTGTVTVTDSKGATVSFSAQAVMSIGFSTNAPATIALSPGPFGAQTYVLSGGTPPYKAVSNFPSAVSVVVNGSDVTVTALQAPEQGTYSQVTITYTDSSGSPDSGGSLPLQTLVTLGSAFTFNIFPNTVTMAVGTTFRAVMTGGTPPYRAVVSDVCGTNVQIVNGNQLQMRANEVCTGSVVNVFDANNQTTPTPLTFTINAAVTSLMLSPPSLTIPESATTPNINLTVYAFNADPLQVFSTDTSILPPQTPVQNADGTYTITLIGGNTCSLPVSPGSPAVTTPTFVPAVPATGGDRSVTITVLNAQGKVSTSVITIKDANGISGC